MTTKLTKLIEDAKRSGLEVRKISQRYEWPCVIVRKGRGATSVTVWEDGSITRADIPLHMTKRMSVGEAAKLLQIA